MTMTLGVIVCAYTFDRIDDITDAIASLEAQRPVPDKILLVVDHNDELLAESQRRWPQVTVLANSGAKGLSGARNTGILACDTDVVAFLDDDAVAAEGWLAHLSEAYTDADVKAIGGRARPRWSAGGQPATLPAELFWVVGCTYTGQPTTTADVRNVMGCSMSFRRSVFTEVGGFIEGIGRVGTLPLGCEETELCIRIKQRDPSARIVFEPGAVVDHRVGAARGTWSYLLRRSYAEGISKAAVAALLGAGDSLSTERSYTSKVLPKAVLRELVQRRPQSALAIIASLGGASLGYLRARLTRTTISPSGDGALLTAADAA
jgi:GT2 family glycosyltransferase